MAITQLLDDLRIQIRELLAGLELALGFVEVGIGHVQLCQDRHGHRLAPCYRHVLASLGYFYSSRG
ncbi:hypothetical protein D3C71_2250340 [compost metagenome]